MNTTLGIKKVSVQLWFLIGILVVLIFTIPGQFYNYWNIQSILNQVPELGVLAIGMLVVVLTGGIDLSIASTSALSGVVSAMIMMQGRNGGFLSDQPFALTIVAMLAGLAVALGCGALNGTVISYIGVHPVLATLGTMTAYNGICMGLTRGGEISGFTPQFSKIGSSGLGPIPTTFIILIAAAVVAHIILQRTIWGRNLYMFGSNQTATLYSGVNTAKTNFKVYLFSAVMSYIAGIIMTSRYNTSKADLGASYLLQSIAIVILGGANINGGEGKVPGVFIAVFIIQILKTVFNIIGMNPYTADVVSGIILIVVLLTGKNSATRIVIRRKQQEELQGKDGEV